MSISGVQLARVSNLLVSGSMKARIQDNQQQLYKLETELSTGKVVNVPSDNPGAAAIIMQLQKTLEQRSGYSTNLDAANSQLSEVDSTLNDLTSLVQQAVSTASANVGSDVTPAQRASAAQIVQSLSNQLLSVANKQFNGQYLFGGDKSDAAPFVVGTAGVQFNGSTTVIHNQIDNGASVPTSVSATDVFGALSGSVTGSTNLGPRLQTTTRIADLIGTTGNGVKLGSIQIGNGTTTKLVDLSGASNLGDAINDINAAGLGNISAQLTLSGNGLQLVTSGTDNITVQDVGGGNTAQSLGILRTTGAGAGQPLVGTNPVARVTDLTALADLRGGAGIDTTNGFTITNGGNSATINLSVATTVEDLLNAVNGAGIGVTAAINATGDGIDIRNSTQGATMTIAEHGGTTAADLGVRSFGPVTPLSQLNGGKGIGTVAGADFQVTDSAGATFMVDLGSGQQTVQDVINAINAAATTAGVTGVTAAFAATGNGITLADTAGGAGTITVTPQNFSTAAADLGLTVPARGNTIRGADVNAVAVDGLFSDLTALQKALQANDRTAITAAGSALQADQARVANTRGAVGAHLQEVNNRKNRLADENLATHSMLSTLQDTDFTTAVTDFQTLQTALQATLQTAAKTLQLNLMNFLG